MISQKRMEKNAVNIGKAIRDRRTEAGYTQKGLGDRLGLEYYSMVSQMELGYISIPPALWEPLNDVLKFEPSELSVLCLSEYQPDIFKALFGNASRREVIALLSKFRKGKIKTEE